MRHGKATRPLRLPLRAPRCFDSQPVWNQYRADAEYTAGDGFTFCTDCTPARQAKMIAAGRCAYPGTTFSLVKGLPVGRRG